MNMVRVKELAETVFANGVVGKDKLYNRNLHGAGDCLWLCGGSALSPHIKIMFYCGSVDSITFERCTKKEHFERAFTDLEQYAIDVVEAKGSK